jgi:hypothetical protein
MGLSSLLPSLETWKQHVLEAFQFCFWPWGSALSAPQALLKKPAQLWPIGRGDRRTRASAWTNT